MRIHPSIGLIMLVPGLALEAAPPELPEPLHWTIDGQRREAIVIFPDGPRRKPAPLVFVFHGHGSTMEAFTRRMPIQKLWPEAVAVYMQGLPTASRVDPKGKRMGWQSQAGTEGNRDLKFFDVVLKTVRRKHSIDQDRVYATGLSNGGNFTYVLWSARPGVFAACAPVAAILRYPENVALKPGALLHIAGEKDRTAPFEMQLESMAKVREINGCKDDPVEWASACKLYPPEGNSGAPFVSFIHPGGHGAPPHSLELIIKFFKQHPLVHNGATSGRASG
jgi:polyhydroxybutyrate depolymerase